MFVSLWRWHFTLLHSAISQKLVVGTYGWRHSSVQCKKRPRSSPQTFLSNHTFLTQTTFWRDKFFSIHLKYWQISKYTALISKFSFPKIEKSKSKFRMINLCNDGTKDFMEIWEVIHLNLYTHFASDKQNYSKLT